MNNCLNCRHCKYAQLDKVTGHYCTYDGWKKIKFPMFKGGNKKCECYYPVKRKPNILTEYPKKG